MTAREAAEDGDARGAAGGSVYLEAADGVRLHAVVRGGGGPLLLLLHGFPEFWLAWHAQIPEFARDHRVAALDLRGYNLSDKPPRTADYALPRIVEDVRRALRTFTGGAPAIVVGHDWGGIAAWVLARESPELVARLVILNAPHPAIFHRELKHSAVQSLASSYAAFFQARGVAEATLRAFGFAALRAMVFGTTSKPAAFPPELRAEYLRAWAQPGALRAGLSYYRNVRALKRVLTAAPSWRIDVPTLVLWGERDPALRPGNLDGLGDFVPRLTLARHPRATHWIAHEEPAWVNGAIRAFLAGSPVAASA